MKKLLLIASLLTSLSAGAEGSLKYLHYNYNDSVKIIISTMACPFPEVKAKYPLAAAAIRIDGQSLKGCYKPVGDDVEIQWQAGDISTFPANNFLLDMEGNK